MTLEDQILSYLDGTLGEEASAELLHTLSVSPEKRMLLEEHLQMKELFQLGQRPFAVPQSVERALAERIPVLAENEAEPAVPIFRYAAANSVARQGAVAMFLAGIRNFVGGHSVATAFSLGSLVLAGGLAWYSVTDHDQSRISSASNSNRSSSSLAAHSSSPVTSDQTYTELHSNAPTSQSTSGHQEQSTTSSRLATNAATNSSHNDHRVLSMNYAKALVSNITKNGNGASANVATPNDPASANSNIAGENQSEDFGHAVARIEPKSVAASPAQIHPQLLAAVPLDLSDGHADNITLGVSYGSYAFQMPNMARDSAQTSVQNPELSIAYNLSSHFAIGVEGGSMLYATVENTSMRQPTTIAGYSRVSYSSVLRSSQALWSRVLIGYTLNPFDAYQIRATASGGAAFENQTSPNAAFALGLSRELWGAMTFDIAAVASGTWSSISGAGTATLAPDAAGTTGIVRSEIANQKLFTPAFGIRAGISYRL